PAAPAKAAADTVRASAASASPAAPAPPPVPVEPPGFADRVRMLVATAYEWVRVKLGGAPAPVLPPAGALAQGGDSVPLPTRGELVGVWSHGDRRSSLGDSLTLELRADGAARLAERRFSLDRGNQWSLARPQRVGSWAVRGSDGTRPELCITWHQPAPPVSTCERVQRDSLPGGRILTYGGRHWREQLAPAPKPERAVSRRRRAPGSSS
ncbi:hypothetical protein PYV61_22525, partial [Roseisolibacter sp. H3M3-2]